MSTTLPSVPPTQPVLMTEPHLLEKHEDDSYTALGGSSSAGPPPPPPSPPPSHTPPLPPYTTDEMTEDTAEKYSAVVPSARKASGPASPRPPRPAQDPCLLPLSIDLLWAMVALSSCSSTLWEIAKTWSFVV
ncbi:hypothetical protein F5Y03DRAFT_390121 [Xylaria venustula]|nr:hypothetical protein F5Y03DRAFT_390121 [Xylaria venustula]